jgi:acyl-CoA hydrolase
VQGCSGQSALLSDAVKRAGDALGAMTFIGIFVPGLNRATWLANPACRARSFFMTPELKQARDAVEFLPLCYADILAHLRRAPIDAALFMVAPPDANGLCSFGPVVDFLAELWPRIPDRIAHINPQMPSTHGHPGIPFSKITTFVEADMPLLGAPRSPADPVSQTIGENIALLIEDGATVQTGLGKIPDAVLLALTDRRGLRIHSGLIGNAVLDLIDAGALADGPSVTSGVAIGSPALYAAIGSPKFVFRSVSYTHVARAIAGIEDFVAINSAIGVDLLGQAYGARIGGGLRVVALPSDAASASVSRIVGPAKEQGRSRWGAWMSTWSSPSMVPPT